MPSNVDNYFEQPKDGKDNKFNLDGTWLIDGTEVTATAESINATDGLETVADTEVVIKSGTVFDGGVIGTDVGDMNKSTYDTDNNSIVDNSEQLGGKPANEYVTTDTDQAITGTKTFDSIKYNLTAGVECEEGQLAWNEDAGTLEVGMPGGGGVCGQILQENLIRVTNKSGGLILNGTPVYVSGAAGNNIWIDVADAASPDANRKTLAIATEDIINNQKGFVTTFGFVRTIDTDTFDEGDELFVAVGGGLTKVKPVLPNGIVRVGFCTRSSVEEGSIFVTIATKSVKDIQTDTGDLTIKTAAGYTWVVDQPTWQDLIMPITRGRLPAANYPALETFKGNLKRYTFDINDYVSFDNEAVHDYKEGTVVLLHVHGSTNGVDVTDRTIKYQAEITVGNDQYSVTGIGTVFTDTFVVDTEFTIPANTPDRSGFYFDIGAISVENMKLGAQMCFDFKRIAASGTDPSNDPFVITVGAHYLQDTNGSRQMLTK